MNQEKHKELMAEYRRKAIASQLRELEPKTIQNINSVTREDMLSAHDWIEKIIIWTRDKDGTIMNTDEFDALNPEAVEIALWAMRDKLGFN